VLSSFTWAKNLDTADPIDGITIGREKALSANNIARRFVASYIWELPRLTGAPALVRHLFGNWETNGIVSAESGLPINVVSGRDNSATGINADRPDLVGDPFLPGGSSRTAIIERYFNVAAFRQNPPGTFGTAGRNILTGPGEVAIDLGLIKNIPVAEGHRLQLRGEAFNALNRVNLDNPNANINTANAGRITSAGSPRVFQVALRYSF
jgi:hypothetical protein